MWLVAKATPAVWVVNAEVWSRRRLQRFCGSLGLRRGLRPSRAATGPRPRGPNAPWRPTCRIAGLDVVSRGMDAAVRGPFARKPFMPSSLPAGARCSTRPSTRRSDGWRPKTRGAATARGPQCRAGRQLRLRVPPWSRRVGGAGGRHRDGATATLAVKHALVAECDKCFFDECSRREWLLHRILRPTSPLAPEYCSNDARRCERPRRRRRRPVDALLPRGSFTSRSKLPVVYRRGRDASSSGIASLVPAGTGPASWARTAVAFLERPVRVLV